MSASAINLGHQQANQAEYHSELQQWKQAKECHELAAKYFLEALDCSADSEVRNTLILLNKNHTRQAQTIQETHLSKTQKKKKSLNSNLLDERRQIDAFYPTRINSESSQGLNSFNLNNTSNNSSNSTINSMYKSGFPAIQLNDESFMLLKDQELDPFDRFLDTVEELVQKISNPVAFATVPLNFDTKPKKQIPKHIESSKMSESFYFVPSPNNKKNYEGSNNELISTKTIEEYSEENHQLKIAVDQLTKQLHSVEKTSEENNNLLKSSIMQFKTDVQKQAQQLRVNQQDMLKSSILIKNRNLLSNEAIGSVLYGSASKSSSSSCLGNCKKVKELEDEIKSLQAELVQKNDIINMHKKRWENLKQSAKKRGSNTGLNI